MQARCIDWMHQDAPGPQEFEQPEGSRSRGGRIECCRSGRGGYGQEFAATWNEKIHPRLATSGRISLAASAPVVLRLEKSKTVRGCSTG